MNSLTDITIEKIKTFSPELTPLIDALAKQIGQNYEGITDEALKQIIDSDVTHLLIAKDKENGQLIGMITLVIYRIPYKTKGWLEDLVVDQSYRGRGVATLLLENAIDLARTLHVKKLDFTSKPERESANNLYAKLGFQKRNTNVYRLSL